MSTSGRARTSPKTPPMSAPTGPSPGEHGEQRHGIGRGARDDRDDAEPELGAEARSPRPTRGSGRATPRRPGGATSGAAAPPTPQVEEQPDEQRQRHAEQSRRRRAPRRRARRPPSERGESAQGDAPERGGHDVGGGGQPPPGGAGPLTERADAREHRLASRGPGGPHRRDHGHRQPDDQREPTGAVTGRPCSSRASSGSGRLEQARVTGVDAGRGAARRRSGSRSSRPPASRRRRWRAAVAPGAGAPRGRPGVGALLDGLLEQVAHGRPRAWPTPRR